MINLSVYSDRALCPVPRRVRGRDPISRARPLPPTSRTFSRAARAARVPPREGARDRVDRRCLRVPEFALSRAELRANGARSREFAASAFRRGAEHVGGVRARRRAPESSRSVNERRSAFSSVERGRNRRERADGDGEASERRGRWGRRAGGERTDARGRREERGRGGEHEGGECRTDARGSVSEGVGG